VFSTKRACPDCGALRRARSSPLLVQLQTWLVRQLLRYRRGDDGFDESRAARRSGGTSGTSTSLRRAEACDGQRLNPIALNVRFRDRSVASLAGGSVERTVILLEAEADSREQQIGATCWRKSVRAWRSGACRLGYCNWIARHPRSRERGAAHQLARSSAPICRGVTTGRADDWPAPADNEVLLGALTQLSGQRNTLVSWSMMKRRFDGPTMSRSRAAAGVRGARSSELEPSTISSANPRPRRALLREPLQTSAQPHRG